MESKEREKEKETDEQDLDNKKSEKPSDKKERVLEEREGTTESPEQKIKQLEAEMLYLKADAENYKKRLLKEKEQSVQFANERYIREIISVMDHLDRAINHGTELREKNKEDKELFNFVYGVELTQREFMQALAKFGVEFIGEVGENFDPSRHEAVFQREVDDENQVNTLLEVVQKGSLLHGRLLKPAKVVVGCLNSVAKK